MIKFEAIGRLTNDPETRYTEKGASSTTFTIAVNNSKTEDATFLKITTFGSTGELIQKYVNKGSMIYVEGSIKNNNFTDKEGKKHFEYSFIGHRVEFLSSKGNSTSKEEKPKKEDKNGLSDEVFANFGNGIDVPESELAF